MTAEQLKTIKNKSVEMYHYTPAETFVFVNGYKLAEADCQKQLNEIERLKGLLESTYKEFLFDILKAIGFKEPTDYLNGAVNSAWRDFANKNSI